MKKYLLLLLLVSLAGCSGYKNYKAIQPKTQSYDLTTSSVYIPIVKDGMDRSFASMLQGIVGASNGLEVAEGSGVEVRNVINNNLSNIHKIKGLITLGTKTESLEEALLSARNANSEYLLYTNIKVWQDPWGGNCSKDFPDYILIDLYIYDVKTGNKLEEINMEKGACATTINNIPLFRSSPKIIFNGVFKAWLKDTQLQKTNS